MYKSSKFCTRDLLDRIKKTKSVPLMVEDPEVSSFPCSYHPSFLFSLLSSF